MRMPSKSKAVVAGSIRTDDCVHPDKESDMEQTRDDEYVLGRTVAPVGDGLVDWLLDCPEQGYFVPVESDSTDDL